MQNITYNAFNKVETVTKGIAKLSITYGPNRQRTKTELIYNSTTTTTLYADNYEQRTKNGTTTTYHYVASPDGLVAVYIKPKSATKGEMYYIETDHLGSIVRAYDYVGNTKFSASYDAWGNQTISTNAISLSRGYTGHEHWNQFGLIDMNGRFYDPLLGRFLSPDPYVQMPENPQNFNRYAYCLNNPLKYTDPSGERCALIGQRGDDDEYHSSGGGGGGYYSVITLGEVRGVNTAGEPYVHAYTITMYNYNHYYGPKSTSNYNNNYYGKYHGGGGSTSGSGGKAIRQPIHKKVVVQKGGGGVITGASYANTVVNSAFNSAWKNAPNANLGSNNRIYWNGKFHGNQYVKVRALAPIARPIANGTFVVGAVISGIQIYYTYESEGNTIGPQTQAAAAEAVGGLAGGSLGAWGGAELGGVIGSFFGGIGAIPGAVIGGFIGGVGGSFGGAYATDKAYEYYINKQ